MQPHFLNVQNWASVRQGAQSSAVVLNVRKAALYETRWTHALRAHAVPFIARGQDSPPDGSPSVPQFAVLALSESRAALIHCCGEHTEPKTSRESDFSDRVYSAWQRVLSLRQNESRGPLRDEWVIGVRAGERRWFDGTLNPRGGQSSPLFLRDELSALQKVTVVMEGESGGGRQTNRPLCENVIMMRHNDGSWCSGKIHAIIWTLRPAVCTCEM